MVLILVTIHRGLSPLAPLAGRVTVHEAGKYMSRKCGMQTKEYPAHAVCGNRHTACAGYIIGRERLPGRL